MDAAELAEFRALLRKQMAELLDIAESGDAAALPVELDQTSVGRLSRMDAIQGQQMALEAVRRRAQQRARIEAALARIDAGRFGQCVVCGEEIDPRRLRFDPTTVRCVACMR